MSRVRIPSGPSERTVKKLNTQFSNVLETYDTAWFEIRTEEKKIIIRNRDEFVRKSEAMSKIREVTLYKIEKTSSGFRKSRVHAF